MQAVWKFPLGPFDLMEIDMPTGSRVLCVQCQDGAPQLWALCDVSAPKQTRVFHIYGTGHTHGAINGEYVGTFQLADGALVFHVFEDVQVNQKN